MYINNIVQLTKAKLPATTKLLEGNTISGKISLTEGNKGTLKLYDGTIIPAVFVFENDVDTEKYNRFIIRGFDGENFILKLVGESGDAEKEQSLNTILRDLNIPMDEGKKIIMNLIKYNLPATNENINMIYKSLSFIKNIKNMSDNDILAFLSRQLNENVSSDSNLFKITKDMFSRLKKVDSDFLSFLIENDIDLTPENVIRTQDFINNKFFMNNFIDSIKNSKNDLGNALAKILNPALYTNDSEAESSSFKPLKQFFENSLETDNTLLSSINNYEENTPSTNNSNNIKFSESNLNSKNVTYSSGNELSAQNTYDSLMSDYELPSEEFTAAPLTYNRASEKVQINIGNQDNNDSNLSYETDRFDIDINKSTKVDNSQNEMKPSVENDVEASLNKQITSKQDANNKTSNIGDIEITLTDDETAILFSSEESDIKTPSNKQSDNNKNASSKYVIDQTDSSISSLNKKIITDDKQVKITPSIEENLPVTNAAEQSPASVINKNINNKEIIENQNQAQGENGNSSANNSNSTSSNKTDLLERFAPDNTKIEQTTYDNNNKNSASSTEDKSLPKTTYINRNSEVNPMHKRILDFFDIEQIDKSNSEANNPKSLDPQSTNESVYKSKSASDGNFIKLNFSSIINEKENIEQYDEKPQNLNFKANEPDLINYKDIKSIRENPEQPASAVQNSSQNTLENSSEGIINQSKNKPANELQQKIESLFEKKASTPEKLIINSIIDNITQSIKGSKNKPSVSTLQETIETFKNNKDAFSISSPEAYKKLMDNLEVLKKLDDNYSMYFFNMYNTDNIFKNNIIIKHKYKSSKYIDINDVKAFLTVDTEALGTVEGNLYKKNNDVSIAFNVNKEHVNLFKNNTNILKKILKEYGYNFVNISVEPYSQDKSFPPFSDFFNESIFRELDVKV